MKWNKHSRVAAGFSDWDIWLTSLFKPLMINVNANDKMNIEELQDLYYLL